MVLAHQLARTVAATAMAVTKVAICASEMAGTARITTQMLTEEGKAEGLALERLHTRILLHRHLFLLEVLRTVAVMHTGIGRGGTSRRGRATAMVLSVFAEISSAGGPLGGSPRTRLGTLWPCTSTA